eukprot:g378.t1
MTVTVIVGLLVVLGVIYGVYVLCRITCFWEAEVRKERRLRVHPEEYVGEDEGASGHQISLLAAWTRVLSYWFGSRGPNYYQLQFLLEVLELVTQLLALERYSTTGMTKSFLGVYSGIILANAMTPLLFVYIIHDQHKHNNLQRLGVWTRRLLLVDCFCDIQSAAVCDASPFSRCGDSRAYLMLSVSAEVLLGGTTVWDVAIKIVTRLVPLLIALEKARVAFLLAYVVDAVDNVKTAERLPTIVQQQHAHEKEEDTAEKQEDEEDEENEEDEEDEENEEENGPARVDKSLPQRRPTNRQMDAVRFDWNRITEVPNAISKLNVEDLGLNGNLLVALPETLYDIRRLRNLHLAFNNITVLSPALGKVTTLKRLMVQYNRLSQLPEGLAFPRLEHITFNNNSLTSQLSILSGWSVPSLERLDLESNLIEGPFSTSIAADAPNRLVGDAKPTQVFLGHNNFCAARPGSVESVMYNSMWNVTSRTMKRRSTCFKPESSEQIFLKGSVVIFTRIVS